MTDYIFLVPCAGYGSRMNSVVPKQYLEYNNKPIIYYTLKILENFNFPILLIVSPDDDYIDKYKHLFSKHINIQYIGGETRAETVLNGLNYLIKNNQKNPWILVHDGARPFVNYQDIHKLIEVCTSTQKGGILATKVVDTIKRKDINQNITTLDRNNLYLAQTPQMFKLNLLFTALKTHKNLSDEASAIEKMQIIPMLVESSRFNIKITTPEDLEWLQFLKN